MLAMTMLTGWAHFARKFQQYYQHSRLWTPPRIEQREWMFIPFGGAPPLRHIGFHRIQDVRQFVSTKTMHSCFYSTAYWNKPNETKMIDKEWQGADLIFDLDGDHLPGISDNDFPAMIDIIQEQAWSLWNDFLQPEFGFSEEFLQVTFSGHRGFHLHYRDPSFHHIDSEARREMVSHIRGEGVDVAGALARFTQRDAKGWTRRLKNGMGDLIDSLVDIDNQVEHASRELKRLEAGLKAMHEREPLQSQRTANSIRKLAQMMNHPEKIRRLKEESKFEVLGQYQELFLNLLRSDKSIVLGNAGETDEVVTIDVRRQIRWPSSLHGKSGMRVTEFPLSQLDPDSSNRFHPLDECYVFGMEQTQRVEIIKDDIRAKIGSQFIDATRGDVIETSESGATFLVLKGWAHQLN
jgi:DNA primase small subunit